MRIRGFFLGILFLAGVALGWLARGANDGNVIEKDVKVAVDKAEAVEQARWEKQVRDLEMSRDNLLDKLAVASKKDVIIDRLTTENEALKAKIAAEPKGPAESKPTAPPTAPTDSPKPDEPKP